MSADSLFPPTPLEHIGAVVNVLDEERRYRVHMLRKYGDEAGQLRYWQGRVTQTDEALAHLAALAVAVTP